MEAPKENPQPEKSSLIKDLIKELSSGVGAFFGGLKSTPGFVKEGFVEAKAGLRSIDPPTRRMSILFYLTLLGVGFTFYGFGKYMMEGREQKRLIQIEVERVAAEAKLKAEELRRLREPPPYQTMGTFSLQLREVEGVAKTSGLREAELEIVLACSEPEACEWIKANVDRARGELGPLFTPTDRDKILSPAGKRALREEIREYLNRLLEEKKVRGTIIEVLFPRFIVS